MTTSLTLALPKGRLLDPALALLAGMGIRGIEPDSRRLLVADETAGLRFILLKPADIPTYVEYGAADLGIVGKDILLEQQPDVYEPVDLGFGFCRLVVAEPRELWERDDPAKWSWVRVATKYPRLTEEYFSERGIQVEMVKLDGSIARLAASNSAGAMASAGPDAARKSSKRAVYSSRAASLRARMSATIASTARVTSAATCDGGRSTARATPSIPSVRASRMIMGGWRPERRAVAASRSGH